MPRTKGYRTTRRKRKPRKKRNFLQTAERALAVAQGVRKLLNVEFKVYDIVETSTTVGNSGTLISLNHIPQGGTSITREGDSVLNKTLQFKYYATQHDQARDTFVRIVLLVDKAPNGTMTTPNHIYSENRVTGHLHLKHMHRYQILSEQLIALNSSSTEYSIGKKFHELEFHTKYEETGNLTHNIEKNQLLLYMISNEPTNTPTVHWSTRLRYIDN